jgi:hypothetical protein
MTTLVNYWPLDEASGTTVTDTVGGLVGTVENDPSDDTIVAAKFGNGRDTSQSASVASVQLYSGTNDSTYLLSAWTISFWMHLSATPTVNNPNILNIGRYYESSTYPDFTQVFVYGSKGNAQLYVDVYGGTSDVFTSHNSFTTWTDEHHIAITGDGTNVCVYLDGVKIKDVACDAGLTPKHQSSRASVPANTAPGVFDDIAIWDGALTQEDIDLLYNSGAGTVASSVPAAAPSEPPWDDIAALPTVTRYTVLDIEHDTLDTIRPPISSWQATTQSGQSSFSQAVIPAALTWVDAISDRLDTGVMVITHGVRHVDGTTQEWEVIRAPIQQFFFDQGPMNATARISSYYTVAAMSPTTTKVLRNIRSISTSSAGLRVRCDFDPTIKPGDTVSADGTEYTVAYINAYQNSSDFYMDVGERAV